MINYYISIDGGGSKINVILFSSDFQLISSATASSANAVSISKEVIQKNLRSCFQILFGNTNITIITKVYSCILCPINYCLEELVKYVTVLGSMGISEGMTGLYSNCVTDSAIVALSGTGSHVAYIKNRQMIEVIGGWGVLFPMREAAIVLVEWELKRQYMITKCVEIIH